jgi:hypothetical protein
MKRICKHCDLPGNYTCECQAGDSFLCSDHKITHLSDCKFYNQFDLCYLKTKEHFMSKLSETFTTSERKTNEILKSLGDIHKEAKKSSEKLGLNAQELNNFITRLNSLGQENTKHKSNKLRNISIVILGIFIAIFAYIIRHSCFPIVNNLESIEIPSEIWFNFDKNISITSSADLIAFLKNINQQNSQINQSLSDI